MKRSFDRRLIAGMLIVVFMVLLTACGGSASPKIDGPSKIVTDTDEREVEIPQDPKRVVCMYASTAHIMAMLGVADRIVGCSEGVRRDQMMLTMYPEIADTSAPYHDGTINIEELLSLKPDLIIVKMDTYVNDGTREQLNKSGVPYIVTDYTSVNEVGSAVSVLGEVFGKQKEAKSYIDYMYKTINMVTDRLEDVPEEDRPTVYHAVTEATKTDIIDNMPAEVMGDAGLRNISSEAGTISAGKSASVTLEQIYSWNPDAIICNEWKVADYIRSQSKWSGLKAVENGRVYTMPIGATRWCHPGSMEPQMGALYLAKLFYSDRFEDVDMTQTIKDYYKKYFRMTIDDELAEKILSGKGMRESSPELVME